MMQLFDTGGGVFFRLSVNRSMSSFVCLGNDARCLLTLIRNSKSWAKGPVDRSTHPVHDLPREKANQDLLRCSGSISD